MWCEEPWPGGRSRALAQLIPTSPRVTWDLSHPRLTSVCPWVPGGRWAGAYLLPIREPLPEDPPLTQHTGCVWTQNCLVHQSDWDSQWASLGSHH